MNKIKCLKNKSVESNKFIPTTIHIDNILSVLWIRREQFWPVSVTNSGLYTQKFNCLVSCAPYTHIQALSGEGTNDYVLWKKQQMNSAGKNIHSIWQLRSLSVQLIYWNRTPILLIWHTSHPLWKYFDYVVINQSFKHCFSNKLWLIIVIEQLTNSWHFCWIVHDSRTFEISITTQSYRLFMSYTIRITRLKAFEVD